MNKIKKVNIFFLLKTGIGSAVSIILAESLGFAYSPSAGIITLLTIQNTKKETISIALRRIEAFILAVLISYIVFFSLGYTAIAFGVFVFLFVALCLLLGLKDGISMNAVLMTHFLIEKRMDLPLIMNEIALLFIGMGIGILLNLIMPRYRERIRREQISLEEVIKKTLRGMGNMLREKDSCMLQGNIELNKNKTSEESIISEGDIELNGSKISEGSKTLKGNKITERYELIPHISDDVAFARLDELLDGLLQKAYEDAGNTLLSDTKYLVSYLEMRKLQIGVLKNIKENIEHIPVLLRQTFPIADFMDNIAASFHELNNAKGLLLELEELQEYFRKETLPATREEFEYRATLFQILKELEYFLVLKRNFIKELETKNMKSYWL
ncbi:MAG: putative rane protein [Herbinix sp.]|jgi:uncharacterized membrane protein YgaE (UPF0421/DUF939 family)|nr:putative rane protein [Herbinix sp.]